MPATPWVLLVEKIWHLSILIFGMHRYLVCRQSTHLGRSVAGSGVFTEHVYGRRGKMGFLHLSPPCSCSLTWTEHKDSTLRARRMPTAEPGSFKVPGAFCVRWLIYIYSANAVTAPGELAPLFTWLRTYGNMTSACCNNTSTNVIVNLGTRPGLFMTTILILFS